MIYEVADFRISPDQKDAFEEAIQRGVNTVIANATGFRRHTIKRCIETPGRYLLIIEWETLENHTKDFRESDAFKAWRDIVGSYFSEPPVVEHFETVA